MKLRRLAELCERTMHQQGFDEIKLVGWDVRHKAYIDRKMKKIWNIFYHRRKLHYINQWKSNTLDRVTTKTKKQAITLHHEVQNSNYLRIEVKDKIINAWTYEKELSMKRFCLIALFDHRAAKLRKKESQVDIAEKIVGLRQRLAVQKWKARTKKTIISR